MLSTTTLRSLVALAILSAVVSASPLWLRRDARENELPFYALQRRSLALEDYRLPRDLIPSHYDVRIVPYFLTPADKSFTFDGRVEVTFKVVTATSTVKLHAAHMNVDEGSVQVVNTQTLEVTEVTSISLTTDDKNFFTLGLATSLEQDATYRLSMNYVGLLSDDLEGFYRSSYTDPSGEVQWMGVTHFEANAARRAFPCFDEPDMKATFTLHIAREPGKNILANMPMERDTEDVEGQPGWMWVDFQESVPMSTYLVAFSVSEFESVVNPDDETFKAWARGDIVHNAEYANNLADDVINFFEDYTQVEYVLPKMDQIAIPDFAAGAMENWGLVTYREAALLYDPAVSSSGNKMSTSTVVAHEFAHQWFGDHVSPEWWSNLWLNEGFATYFQYQAIASLEPTWEMENNFVVEQMHSAFKFDSQEFTHPVLANVDSPASIGSIFDSISYNKGACMVRMMVNLLGVDRFKTGINYYLNDRQFANAHQDDLWRSVGTQIVDGDLPASMTLKDFMDTWTLQSGFPVIHVLRNYASNTADIYQNRFFSNPGSPSAEKWVVPLSYVTAGSPNFDDTRANSWMLPEDASLRLMMPTPEQWVIFNPKQTGYYRVNYDVANWRLIKLYMSDLDNMQKVHVVNRAQLIDDALALARAGLLDYITALDTTVSLAHDTAYQPWFTALSGLGFFSDRLASDPESRGNFQRYMRQQLAAVYEDVGGFTELPEDGQIQKMKRSLILRWACNVRDQSCNTEAAALFQLWVDSVDPDLENPITPDQKSVVYCAGMREGGRAEYDFLFARYRAASDASEKGLLLSALGCSSDTALLQTYLTESIKEGSEIRTQDSRSVVQAVYSNPAGVDLTLNFLIANFERIRDIYGGFGVVGRVFLSLAEKLNTQSHYDKLQRFRDENEAELGESLVTALNGAIETVSGTLRWHREHQEEVDLWFTANYIQ